MTPLASLFFFVCAVALVSVPRQRAPFPLLACAFYMTLGQGVDVGPFSFTIIRMMIVVGFARVLIRRERIAGGWILLDTVMVVWGVWAAFSSRFHPYIGLTEALVYRLGLTFNTWGIYFLLRIFCQSAEDVKRLCGMVALMLIPVAVEMCMEQVLHKNIFAFLGGVPESPLIRNGRLRAQGPFGHAILAGTVGAACFPLMICLWNTRKQLAIAGLAACGLMVMASASSGPIMTLLAGGAAVYFWKYRKWTRAARYCAFALYVVLDMVMSAPAYYILAKIDLTGSSTGWHRAALIEAAFSHFSEWWVGGTDYTRHWMPSGVTWSAEHTDITNYYIKMGVIGGLPLMILFIACYVCGFSYVGKLLDRLEADRRTAFVVWLLGSTLFAHAVTGVSVYYFDQTFCFIYITLAMIGSMYATCARRTPPTRHPPEKTIRAVGHRSANHITAFP